MFWLSPIAGIFTMRAIILICKRHHLATIIRPDSGITWYPHNNFIPPGKQFRANFLDDCQKWGQVLGWSKIGSGLLQLQWARSTSIHPRNFFGWPHLRYPEVVRFGNRRKQLQTDPKPWNLHTQAQDYIISRHLESSLFNRLLMVIACMRTG